MRSITVWIAVVFFRAQGYGAENVPNGPLILAPNHASFMDHFFAGAFVRRHIQFMAKSQMFGRHPMSWVYNHGGVFPVRRGYADEEAFKTAFTILRRGGAIGMYVEGGRSRNGLVGDGRQGAGSGVWRSSRAPPSCRSRSSALTRCATGSGCASRRSSCATAGRSGSSGSRADARATAGMRPTRSCDASA